MMMFRSLRLAGAVVVGLVGFTHAAAADGNMACSDYADVTSQLLKKYGELPKHVGLANNGGLLEVLTSPGGTTWTVVIHMPNGTTCLLAAGEHWKDDATNDPLPPAGAPPAAAPIDPNKGDAT